MLRRALADDDRDLALVVQPFAALRPHDLAVMGVERRGRLLEIGRRRRELDLEFLDAADMVEMHGDDLAGLHRRQMDARP